MPKRQVHMSFTFVFCSKIALFYFLFRYRYADHSDIQIRFELTLGLTQDQLDFQKIQRAKNLKTRQALLLNLKVSYQE